MVRVRARERVSVGVRVRVLGWWGLFLGSGLWSTAFLLRHLAWVLVSGYCTGYGARFWGAHGAHKTDALPFPIGPPLSWRVHILVMPLVLVPPPIFPGDRGSVSRRLVPQMGQALHPLPRQRPHPAAVQQLQGPGRAGGPKTRQRVHTSPERAGPHASPRVPSWAVLGQFSPPPPPDLLRPRRCLSLGSTTAGHSLLRSAIQLKQTFSSSLRRPLQCSRAHRTDPSNILCPPKINVTPLPTKSEGTVWPHCPPACATVGPCSQQQ